MLIISASSIVLIVLACKIFGVENWNPFLWSFPKGLDGRYSNILLTFSAVVYPMVLATSKFDTTWNEKLEHNCVRDGSILLFSVLSFGRSTWWKSPPEVTAKFCHGTSKKKTETVPCPFMSLFLVRASCLLQDKLQDKAKQDNSTEKSCCSLQTDNFSSENIPIWWKGVNIC
jgi:hypothetical protein